MKIDRELIASVKKSAQVLYVHATKTDGGTMQDDQALTNINNFLAKVVETVPVLTPGYTRAKLLAIYTDKVRKAVRALYDVSIKDAAEPARNETLEYLNKIDEEVQGILKEEGGG